MLLKVCNQYTILGEAWMPSLHRLANRKAQICMHSDDHAPPHFHLWHPDWEALVDLRDFRVIEGSAPKKELTEAIAWAIDNISLLFAKWRELNERDG